MREHPHDEGFVKQIDVVDHRQFELTFIDACIERQVEFRKVFFRLRPRLYKRNFLVRARKTDLFREIEEIEVHLKNWCAAQISRRSKFFNQFLERHVLVRKCFQGRLSHPREGFAESRIAAEVCAQSEII